MYELYNIGTFRENTAEVFGCVTEQTQEFSLFAGRASYIEERTEKSIVHWTSQNNRNYNVGAILETANSI